MSGGIARRTKEEAVYQWSSASTTSCFNFKIPPSLLNKLTILETVWVRNMGDEREYSLAILVILLLLCWPAAIVYYYTRPTKPQYYPPQSYPSGARAFCQACGAPIV